jgi:hypothetical protein
MSLSAVTIGVYKEKKRGEGKRKEKNSSEVLKYGVLLSLS